MKKVAGPIIAGCIALSGALYAWTHLGRVAARVATSSPSTAPTPEAQYDEAELANQMVTVTGPLADHMLQQKPAVVETAGPVVRAANTLDRVANSPAHTDSSTLHRTLEVTRAANLPIEIPAHTTNPKLRGTYQAFVRRSGSQPAGEAAAEVEFLVLNEQQYGDLLSGHFVDAVFSAGNAHEQEVDFTLPPTFDQSAKYYLVFRNGSRSAPKIVQTDFRIDF